MAVLLYGLQAKVHVLYNKIDTHYIYAQYVVEIR